MSDHERAELEAMHAHERQLCEQLDKLDEELLISREETSRVEADKQNLLDEFESLQSQVMPCVCCCCDTCHPEIITWPTTLSLVTLTACCT